MQSIPVPTAEQIAAIRRIQIGLQKIHEANQKINRLIDQNDLDLLGIVTLSSHSQGVTMGSLAEVMRKQEAAFLSQPRAA
jgi:ribosomal protein L22